MRCILPVDRSLKFGASIALRAAGRVSAVLVLGACVSVASTSAALASGDGDGCNPGRADNYDTGYQNGIQEPAPTSPYGGISANVDDYSPFVYNTTGDGARDSSSQWVMLYNSATDDYAQIGWLEWQGGDRNTFVETGVDNSKGGYWDHWYDADPRNWTSTYEILLRDSDTFQFFVDSVEVYETNLSWLASPNYARVDDEIHTKASQMPGGTSNNDDVSGGKVFYPKGGNGSWYDMQAYIDSTTGTSWIGWWPSIDTLTDRYHSWDDACAN